MMMNIRSYKKMMRDLKKGDSFYFNAIGASLSMIGYTRELIREGRIAPDGKELAKMIKPEEWHRFYSGEAIAPQMTYVVIA